MSVCALLNTLAGSKSKLHGDWKQKNRTPIRVGRVTAREHPFLHDETLHSARRKDCNATEHVQAKHVWSCRALKECSASALLRHSCQFYHTQVSTPSVIKELHRSDLLDVCNFGPGDVENRSEAQCSSVILHLL
eukprot:s1553_g16.t1